MLDELETLILEGNPVAVKYPQFNRLDGYANIRKEIKNLGGAAATLASQPRPGAGGVNPSIGVSSMGGGSMR